ncbi:isoleucine--tRNA ligase [Nitrosopumilus sp. b1]|uniref:isoleucine--tRNA ligase n=1 Tax=Nitrosopumilus sp. b1 TaxID=2109907 RepID=UPI0015F39A77|nr:isoleucine--tRNA ligase [Nitrosopumilus sp. b1]KAF6242427.1 isoleucine--tRNA ligase [Nitrosopumilus sp. b1]
MELAKEFDSKKIESQMRDISSKSNLHELIFDSKNKDKQIMFIEGPPTMNGIPHAGHLRGRVIKDFWYRYNTLKGFKIIFNAGWDTQGLPVELQAQKELGVTGGKAEIIKTVGIEKLVSECKVLVKKYNEKWVQVDNLLGMSFNQKDAYWTYRDEFIEREWQFLKKANENKILEEDFTVIAYCPSCQTSLSHAEVNQGYEEVKDPSLYYKVKLVDEDAFLIVWTTMPFTLVTDAMVGLNPNEDYHYVKVGNETWIIGKTRLEEFLSEAKIEEHSITKTLKGSEFEGKKYIHPLLDEIPALADLAKEENYHIAVSEEFVDASTGSGLVHLSPANGEEDIAIANRRKVKIFNPIDDEVKFTKLAGKYEGLFVRDTDEKIVTDVKEKNSLVKIGKIKHKYPLCWRSHHPIVWLARKGWFYKLDRLGDKAIDAAEKVEYFFDQPKNRFLGIIKERHPWCISRERFWGCPLPVWSCKDCGNKDWFYSRKEIIASADKLPDGEDFELHRPWIDNLVIKCSKCNSINTEREPYVLDTWHNSGSAPYSSLTDEGYSKYIPAPFFTEGIDQTRGWAYTLLIENVILNNAPVSPYNAFLFQGHVLDKNGSKMSKSLGNVLDAQELLEKYPVDLIRFYFMWKSSPIEPLNFSTDELMSRPYQVLSTLYHLHLYFKQNSEFDKFDKSKTASWAKQNNQLQSPDIWLLSKLQKLIIKTNEHNDKCRFHESAKVIEDFIINLLSQIYIPITRGELWDEDDSKKDRRFAIYAVLQEILRTLDVILHPICPYTTEYLYQSAFSEKNSILLDSWPQIQESLIDEKIEESFDLMKDVVSVSAAARMKGKLKRRWPLNEAIICVEKGNKSKLESLSELLISQLNVEKHSIIETQKSEGLKQFLQLQKLGLPIVPKIELERKQIGPKAKQHMGKLVQMFSETKPEQIISELDKNESFTFDVEGNKIILDKQDFAIDFDAREGYAMAKRDEFIVFISTTRNKEMMARGLVKDLARRLQTLRKERGYNPTDVLSVASILDLDDEQSEMIKEKAKDLSFLVRVEKINFEESCKQYKDDDLDGQKIRISVE